MISYQEDVVQILHSYASWMKERDLSDMTQKVYQRMIEFFLDFLRDFHGCSLEKKDICNIQSRDLRSFLTCIHLPKSQEIERYYRRAVFPRSKKQQIQSFSSINVYVAALKSFVKFLKVHAYLSELRFPRLSKQSKGVKEVGSLSRETSCRLIQRQKEVLVQDGYWVHWRNFSLIALLYTTGLRIQEALSLNHEDLIADFTENLDTENQKMGGWLKVIGKRKKFRQVPVLPWVFQAIRSYQERCPFSHRPSDPLFYGARGARLSPRVFQHWLAHQRNPIRAPNHMTPHSFRHSFATHLIEAGAPLRDVQEMLGHSSLASTQHYVGLSLEVLKKNMEKFHPRFSS